MGIKLGLDNLFKSLGNQPETKTLGKSQSKPRVNSDEQNAAALTNLSGRLTSDANDKKQTEVTVVTFLRQIVDEQSDKNKNLKNKPLTIEMKTDKPAAKMTSADYDRAAWRAIFKQANGGTFLNDAEIKQAVGAMTAMQTKTDDRGFDLARLKKNDQAGKLYLKTDTATLENARMATEAVLQYREYKAKGIDAAIEAGNREMTNTVGGMIQPLVNAPVNALNSITEPARATERMIAGTSYIPEIPRMTAAENSAYWQKDGRMIANTGAEVAATVVLGGATGSRMLATQTGRTLLGIEATYNIGAGTSGKDVTHPDENGNARQMPLLERGLRVTGGVLGARAAINAEVSAPNSVVNKLDDIFTNTRMKPQGEMITPEGVRVKVPAGKTPLEKINDPLEARAKESLSGAKKAVNLPSWDKLSFKLESDGETIHLLNNHTVNGRGYQQSTAAGGGKDVFPGWMSEKQIFKAVKEAYESGKKVGTQIDNKTGDKIVELIGQSKDGMKIRMYVNVTTKQLDTAFPQ